MSLQEIVIGFENYRISCLIGIEPHERLQEQEILVDLKVGIDGSRVIKTENIQDTVDYMLLAEICRKMAEQGHFQLLEVYIAAVLEEITACFHLHWVWMRVKKTAALKGADCTYVEMRKEVK